MRPCACGCPGTGPTWASSRCSRRCDKEDSLADQATATASAALLKLMRWEVTGRYGGITQWKEHPTGTWVRWEDLEAVLASLPAPAAPVIVVQVPDGWRVAQWDGQRYVSIGLPYPTERQANSDCALILARVQ